MNSYKVTYLLNGEEHYDHITERTEKAAQKRVKGKSPRHHSGADRRHHRGTLPARHPRTLRQALLQGVLAGMADHRRAPEGKGAVRQTDGPGRGRAAPQPRRAFSPTATSHGDVSQGSCDSVLSLMRMFDIVTIDLHF